MITFLGPDPEVSLEENIGDAVPVARPAPTGHCRQLVGVVVAAGLREADWPDMGVGQSFEAALVVDRPRGWSSYIGVCLRLDPSEAWLQSAREFSRVPLGAVNMSYGGLGLHPTSPASGEARGFDGTRKGLRRGSGSLRGVYGPHRAREPSVRKVAPRGLVSCSGRTTFYGGLNEGPREPHRRAPAKAGRAGTGAFPGRYGVRRVTLPPALKLRALLCAIKVVMFKDWDSGNISPIHVFNDQEGSYNSRAVVKLFEYCKKRTRCGHSVVELYARMSAIVDDDVTTLGSKLERNGRPMNGVRKTTLDPFLFILGVIKVHCYQETHGTRGEGIRLDNLAYEQGKKALRTDILSDPRSGESAWGTRLELGGGVTNPDSNGFYFQKHCEKWRSMETTLKSTETVKGNRGYIRIHSRKPFYNGSRGTKSEVGDGMSWLVVKGQIVKVIEHPLGDGAPQLLLVLQIARGGKHKHCRLAPSGKNRANIRGAEPKRKVRARRGSGNVQCCSRLLRSDCGGKSLHSRYATLEEMYGRNVRPLGAYWQKYGTNKPIALQAKRVQARGPAVLVDWPQRFKGTRPRGVNILIMAMWNSPLQGKSAWKRKFINNFSGPGLAEAGANLKRYITQKGYGWNQERSHRGGGLSSNEILEHIPSKGVSGSQGLALSRNASGRKVYLAQREITLYWGERSGWELFKYDQWWCRLLIPGLGKDRLRGHNSGTKNTQDGKVRPLEAIPFGK